MDIVLILQILSLLICTMESVVILPSLSCCRLNDTYREADFSETKIGAHFLVMQGTDWWVLFLCLFLTEILKNLNSYFQLLQGITDPPLDNKNVLGAVNLPPDVFLNLYSRQNDIK